METNFPKIIHQIWLKGKDHIPDKYINNINSIKEHHIDNGWQYILWDETMILNLIKNNKDYINTYYKFDNILQKIDFAMYIILLNFGGVYLNVTAYCVKPLNDLLNEYKTYDLIVSELNLNIFESLWCCSNSLCVNDEIIIAKPNTPILKNIIDHIINYKHSILMPDHLYILNKTGSNMFTDKCKEHRNNVKILDHKYFEPCIYNDCELSPNTHIINKHNVPLMGYNDKHMTALYFKFKPILIICCLFMICLIIYLGIGWKEIDHYIHVAHYKHLSILLIFAMYFIMQWIF
jgi:hypothetical protein